MKIRTPISALGVVATLLIVGPAAPISAALRATHGRIAETSKRQPSTKGHGSPLTKSEALDAKACKAIAKDMRQTTNADVTKSEVQSFANATKNALKQDKKAQHLQKLFHDAQVFLRTFDESRFNPVSLAMVLDCAGPGIRAPLVPPVATTTTPSTAVSSSAATSAVTSLVEQSLSVPANEVTVQIDNDEPTWAFWTVNDPNVGGGAGFANLIGGSWEIAAGPGSADVGCAPGPTVPPQVMTYFGQTCPPGNSGNSGNIGTTVLPCGSGLPPQVRPTMITIGCATGNTTVADITWSAWGPTSGQGSGTFNENNCQPDCAQGTFTSVPASVVVSDPVGGVFQDVSITPTSGGLSPVTGSGPGSGWGSGGP